MAKATLGAPAALILLALLAGAAAAQLGPVDPAVTLAFDREALELAAGNETTFNATVTNGGAVDGSVALVVADLDGWTLAVEPASFPLRAGASQPVVLTLTAPAAGAGARSGDVGLTATLTAAAGRTASASGVVGVTRVDPVVVPPPPPPYALYGALALLVALLALGVLLALRRRRARRLAREKAAAEEAAKAAAHAAWLDRETGIGIALLEGPVKFGSRRELVYRVEVENRSARERVAVLGVEGRPEGWTVAPALPQARLKPGERVVVVYHVNPGEAQGGAVATLAFTAKPEEARERDERVTVEVHAPADPRIPDLGDRRVLVPEEPPAPPRAALRK